MYLCTLTMDFVTGFTGLSILKVTKHISSHANLSNLHLCDFFHDSGSRNPRPLNTDRSMSTAGRSFSPQHLTLEWGTLDNSVYVFPVSTIWTSSAVFGKQSMPPPACCLSFQAARAPSPPPPQPAKWLFKGSGSQALLEKKCSPQTPSMSVSSEVFFTYSQWPVIIYWSPKNSHTLFSKK